jgi:hypothetical protein
MNYFVIFAIIVLSFSTSIALSYIVMNRLRNKHPETWEALGRPKRINLSDRITPDGEHFWITGYKKLNDPKFESNVELLKTFNKVFSIITVIFLVIMVVKLVLGFS